MKRTFKNVFTPNDSKVSQPIGKSQCILNQAISVRTAVSMFTRGEKLPPMSVYDTFDEVEADETHPLNRMGIDLDDVTRMREEQRYKANEAQRKHREKEKEEKEKADKEKADKDNQPDVSRSKENDAE